MLIASNAISGQPPKPTGKPTEEVGQAAATTEKAKPDERGTTKEPLVVSPIVVRAYAQKDEQETAAERKEKSEKAIVDWWTIKIGLFTLFILVAQTIAFALQARRLRQTIETMKRIADDQRSDVAASIAIARDSAEAAKKTADTTEDELVSGHRPWVIVSNLVPTTTFRTKNDRLRFKFSLKNVGKTPAVNIFCNSEIMPVRDPQASDFTAALERLRPNKMSPGVTLVTTDSIAVPDSFGTHDIVSTADRQDMAFLLVCVYYSFTFKASDRTGYYVAGYRIFEDKVADDGEISIRFDQYYAHAE